MLFHAKERYVVQTLGSSELRKVALPIPAVTAGVRELAERMLHTMRAFEGIGLAAPQIGHSLRLVTLDVPAASMGKDPSPGELELLPRMPMAIVNPEIIATSEELCERDEGCLSLPEIFAPVVRPCRVVLQGTTLDGEKIVVECGGLLGRCIQHELDHLDGKVFTDRLLPEDREIVESDIRRLEKYGAKHHFQRVVSK